jgi:hypothetical protein
VIKLKYSITLPCSMVIHQRSIRLDHQLDERLKLAVLEKNRLQNTVNGKLPPAIKGSLHLSLSNGMRIIYELFHEEFGYFGPLMDVRHTVEQADYFLLKTNSSDITLDQWISDKIVIPAMRSKGYNEDRAHHAKECLDEVYKNSMLYASKVGKDDYYTRRQLPPPGDEQRQINKTKKVYVEAFISNPICLLRVTDYGRGVDYESLPDKSLPDNIKELPLEQMLDLLEDHGRGVGMLKDRTGHTPLASGPLPFSTSLVLYDWSNMTIMENRQRAAAQKKAS